MNRFVRLSYLFCKIMLKSFVFCLVIVSNVNCCFLFNCCGRSQLKKNSREATCDNIENEKDEGAKSALEKVMFKVTEDKITEDSIKAFVANLHVGYFAHEIGYEYDSDVFTRVKLMQETCNNKVLLESIRAKFIYLLKAEYGIDELVFDTSDMENFYMLHLPALNRCFGFVRMDF